MDRVIFLLMLFIVSVLVSNAIMMSHKLKIVCNAIMEMDEQMTLMDKSISLLQKEFTDYMDAVSRENERRGIIPK